MKRWVIRPRAPRPSCPALGPLKALGSERPSSVSGASPAQTRATTGPRSPASREDRAGAPGPPWPERWGHKRAQGPGPQEPRLPHRPASVSSPALGPPPGPAPRPPAWQPQPHLSRFPTGSRALSARDHGPGRPIHHPAHRPPRSPPHRGAGRRAGPAARCCTASRSSSGGSASVPAAMPSRSREQSDCTVRTLAARPARATAGPAPRPAPLQAAVTHVQLPRPRPGRVSPAPSGGGVALDHACATRPPAGSDPAGPTSLPGSWMRMPSALRPTSRMVLAPLGVQEPSTRPRPRGFVRVSPRASLRAIAASPPGHPGSRSSPRGTSGSQEGGASTPWGGAYGTRGA